MQHILPPLQFWGTVVIRSSRFFPHFFARQQRMIYKNDLTSSKCQDHKTSPTYFPPGTAFVSTFILLFSGNCSFTLVHRILMIHWSQFIEWNYSIQIFFFTENTHEIFQSSNYRRIIALLERHFQSTGDFSHFPVQINPLSFPLPLPPRGFQKKVYNCTLLFSSSQIIRWLKLALVAASQSLNKLQPVQCR